MRHPAPLPDPLLRAPFTVAQADAFGLSRDRLEASDLAHPFRGVHVPLGLLADADDDTRFARLCDAYQAKMPRRWFFSGPTAARIMGVPLPARLERSDQLHVTSTGGFAPSGRHIVGHTARVAETSIMFDRPVRVAAEVWCELASVLTVDELIAAGDRLLSDRPAMLTTRRHLEAAVARHGSGRGARRLREALPQLRDNVWSPKETWVRLVLLRAGLPEPVANRHIYDAAGALVAIGDLVYPKRKIVIEYEGERWHRDARAVIDVDRFNRLSLLGWTIIRIRKHHTAANVVAMVRAALAQG